ncbi:MAG: SDR family oxidoreductase [Pseudomonadota bacterium]
MGNRLSGKKTIVTAAGQGIGRAIVEMFADEGAQVIATDVNGDLLADMAHDAVSTRILDVRDTGAVNAAAADIGQVQVLANVAGFVHAGSVLECDEEAWDFSFDLNVKSMHRMIAAFVPGMLASAEAGNLTSIINMSSGASSIKGAPNRYVYGTTKAAVIGLTKAVAVDFVAKGVRCNAICPGTVRSPSWEERVEELGEKLGGKDKALDMFISRQPMGRVGEAHEIAALATHLAGDESAFTTGVAIPIDGGWTL